MGSQGVRHDWATDRAHTLHQLSCEVKYIKGREKENLLEKAINGKKLGVANWFSVTKLVVSLGKNVFVGLVAFLKCMCVSSFFSVWTDSQLSAVLRYSLPSVHIKPWTCLQLFGLCLYFILFSLLPTDSTGGVDRKMSKGNIWIDSLTRSHWVFGLSWSHSRH